MILKKTDRGFVFHCPGCDMRHAVDERWLFNGDFAEPTFAQSVVVRVGTYTCHSKITGGKISFQGDSTHHLAKSTVPLPHLGTT